MYPYGVHTPTILLFLGSNFSFHSFFFSKILTGDFSASFFYFLFFIFSLSNPFIIYFFLFKVFYVCMYVGAYFTQASFLSSHTRDIMGHDWFKLLYRCAVACGICIYVCMYSYIHNMGACMRTNDTEDEPLQGSHHLFVLPYHT